ncbi:MAG: 50S ribosomal protein L21 [Proteobacteria bacterium]|jgi:large subunit ribosomal protein L21|nr:50S ribosomal protein L21 [Pseudomonadota bacterium]NBY20083.1 50S ribosomal protein L21 [bacterium]
MYAVIRTGGKQYRVEPGFELLVEKLEAEPGKTIALDDVLLYADGSEVAVGKPRVAVTVHALVLGDEKGPKLKTIKYKRRHNYKRTYGHRQDYTRLLIEKFERKGN